MLPSFLPWIQSHRGCRESALYSIPVQQHIPHSASQRAIIVSRRDRHAQDQCSVRPKLETYNLQTLQQLLVC
jgi:hypothetical protein